MPIAGNVLKHSCKKSLNRRKPRRILSRAQISSGGRRIAVDATMSHTTTGILLIAGAAGGAFFYIRKRSRQKSILSRSRRKVEVLVGRASKLTGSTAGFLDKSRAEVERQTKGFAEAISAGKAAYHRVAG
jgi:hypothetical protein